MNPASLQEPNRAIAGKKGSARRQCSGIALTLICKHLPGSIDRNGHRIRPTAGKRHGDGTESDRIRRRECTTGGHLYVADPGAGAILRFQLKDGLPSLTPDLKIGPADGGDVAVDAAGRVYGTFTSPIGTLVVRFSPNGTYLGDLDLGPNAFRAYAANGLAVDAASDVFTIANSSTVLVFKNLSQPAVATLLWDRSFSSTRVDVISER